MVACGSAVIVALGALAAFVRWRKKQQAMQTIPTMPVWTPPAEATGTTPTIKISRMVAPDPLTVFS